MDIHLFIVFPSKVIFVQIVCCGFIVRCGDVVQILLEQARSIGLSGGRENRGEEPVFSRVRYKLEPQEVPPRRKQPHPFNPQVSKVGLARVLIREALHLRTKLRRREYRKVLLSRPCIYGVFGGRFGGFHPVRDRCTGCMRCVQEYPGICSVERNPEFFNFTDSYWMPDDPTTTSSTPVSIVSYEASTGKIPVRGMGYKGGFAGPGWDAIWTDMSEIVRPTRDGVYGREYISTLVDLGRKPKFLEFHGENLKQTSRAIELPIPILFNYLPSGLNNQSVMASIGRASRKAGTYFIASHEQVKHLSEKEITQFIPTMSTSNVLDDGRALKEAPAIELEDYDASAVAHIRDISPQAPIIVRIALTRNADGVATELAREGVDAIHLVANYHGEGWGAGSQLFVGDLIRSVHGQLVKEGLRDEVTLIASGGITLAEHVPKAIICGVDLIALDTTVLVALQAQFVGECASPETGRIKEEKFDPDWGEQRLVNLLASWHDQLIEILSAMGMRDVRRLRGDVGRAMFNEDLEKEAFADIIHRT